MDCLLGLMELKLLPFLQILVTHRLGTGTDWERHTVGKGREAGTDLYNVYKNQSLTYKSAF